MLYLSTRGIAEPVNSTFAIINGIAEDGGLYIPKEFPIIKKSFNELGEMSYQELAFYIIKKYFDDFSDEELKNCIEKAYDSKFQNSDIAPLIYNSGVNFLELYHGKTLAFKDMALSILPYLLITAARKAEIRKDIVILTATSGDTGKAALEGFKDIENTKIVVFYPKDGISEIQKRQMITQEGNNTFVVGIDGNFDDAQNGVKDIFNDQYFNKLLSENGCVLSSANSINIGRLVPQIVYYVYSYTKLLKNRQIRENQKVNIVVPTGNFGNILAAYYAKNMGLPVGRLICASNENKVLTDFINTGVYDRRRTFAVTNSPSMDILISSNLERFLFEISDRNSKMISNLMMKLKNEGRYEISTEMKNKLKILYGCFATEKETIEAVKKVYDESGYVIDTHTAVAFCVYEKYKKDTDDQSVAIIASTASPFKFPRSINEALNFAESSASDFEMVDLLSNKMNLKIPKEIEELEKKTIKHTTNCKKDEMETVIKEILRM